MDDVSAALTQCFGEPLLRDLGQGLYLGTVKRTLDYLRVVLLRNLDYLRIVPLRDPAQIGGHDEDPQVLGLQRSHRLGVVVNATRKITDN